MKMVRKRFQKYVPKGDEFRIIVEEKKSNLRVFRCFLCRRFFLVLKEPKRLSDNIPIIPCPTCYISCEGIQIL